jgi:AcrR family transcriptional regulator
VGVEPDPDDVAVVAASPWIRAPRQARSEETLWRFLHATEALLAERDFADISVDDIVERAGRTVGSFYARFDDKLAVLRVLSERDWAVARRAADRFLAVDRWRDVPLGEVVHQLGGRLVHRARTATPALRTAARYATIDDGFRDDRRSSLLHVIDRFRAVVVDHADEVDHPDPGAAAELALLAMFGLLELRRTYGAVEGALPSDDDALTDQLTVVAVRTLRVR